MGMAGAHSPITSGISSPPPLSVGIRGEFHRHADDRRTTSWVGPLIGAIPRLPAADSDGDNISAVNLLLVGLLLVAFVIVAPNGIVGLVQKYIRHKPVEETIGRRRVKVETP